MLELAMVILALSPVYQSALTVPAMALENVMTCRVHRAVILGLIADRELQTAPLMLTTFNPAISAVTSEERIMKGFSLRTK